MTTVYRSDSVKYSLNKIIKKKKYTKTKLYNKKNYLNYIKTYTYIYTKIKIK